MSAKLVVKQALGRNPTVKNCLTFVGEHQLAYVCGHQVVILHTETKEQAFIPGTSTYQHQSLAFTAVAACPSKKLIAVAEKVEPLALVTFYDSVLLRKKKTLLFPDLGSSEIRCMSFSEDGKYLLTQGAGPEWNLVLWNVEKTAKALCSTKISLSDENPVHRVSFCPWDVNVILVLGKGTLRLFRYIEGSLRPMTITVRRDQANFLAHCWLSEETLVVGTENGELIIIENFEVRGHIATSKASNNDPGSDYNEVGDNTTNNYPVLCLQATTRGFVMGSYFGELRVFEKHEDVKEKYLLEEVVYVSGDSESAGHVMELAMSTTVEEVLVCGMERHQLYSCSVSALHNFNHGQGTGQNSGQNNGQTTTSGHHVAGNLTNRHSNKLSSATNALSSTTNSATNNVVGGDSHSSSELFEPVFANFHHPNNKGEGEITGIDVAIWKNIVVTCAKDHFVRVWNPVEKRMELSKEFDEEPLGLTVHPSGIYLAVMFTDKIRMMSLLLDDIHLVRELPARQVNYVAFSKGGHYLAAGQGTNIQVYHTYTGLPIATLRGHNNRIRNVLWLNYDSRLVTVGIEGVVLVWDLFPSVVKRSEHYSGNIPLYGGACTGDGNIVYVSGQDKTIKELHFGVGSASGSGEGGTGGGGGQGGAMVAAGAGSAGGSGGAAGGTGGGAGDGGSSGGSGQGGAASASSGIEGVVKVTRTMDINNHHNNNNNNNNNNTVSNATSTALTATGGTGGPVASGGGGASSNSSLSAYVSHMLFDDSKKFLLMGTTQDSASVGPSGVFIAMTSPYLGAGIHEMNYLHSVGITAMCLSHDGHTIYTADSHGVIIISEYETAANAAHAANALTTTSNNNNNNMNNTASSTALVPAGAAVSKAGGSVALSSQAGTALSTSLNKQREGLFSFEFVDEVVMHKQDLEFRKGKIDRLQQEVEELQQNNEHQMRLKEMEFKDKLKEITDQATVQLKAEKIKYDELDKEKKALEKAFAEKVSSLEERHIEEIKSIEFKYKMKYNAEENRHKQLMEETKEAHNRWNEENKVLVSSHQHYMEELSREYEAKMISEQSSQKDIMLYKEKISVKFDVLKNDTEYDGDKEVADIKIRYDTLLRAEEEIKQSLATKHAEHERDLHTLKKEEENMELENKRMKDKQNRMIESIHTQEKDIQSHKKEIREREETINDKDKRIYDLKKKNQELEKFRFVLDYKIKELKLQIAPRENEINTMSKQIEEMNAELEQYNKSNLALNLMIEELKLKMEGMKGEVMTQEDRIAVSERFLEKFRRDLQDLWILKGDVNSFKIAMIKMYRMYVQEDVSPATLGGSGGGDSGAGGGAKGKRDLEDPQQVYNRDREQMERSLDSLRRAMKTEAIAHRRDLGKMMRESVLLTKELNTLRKNARGLYLQKKAIEEAGEVGLHTNVGELMEVLGLQQRKTEDLGGGGGKGGGKSTKGGGMGGGTMRSKSFGGGYDASQDTSQDEGEDSLLGGGPLPIAPHPPGGGKGYLPPSRSAALRTTSADDQVLGGGGGQGGGGHSHGHGQGSSSKQKLMSRQDQWEAWREIQIQYDTMKELEDRISEVCVTLGLDAIPVIVGVDTKMHDLYER